MDAAAVDAEARAESDAAELARAEWVPATNALHLQ